MTAAGWVPSERSAPEEGGPAAGRLARAFQEVFTVIVRIRTNRQSVDDPAAFRAHVKRLLGSADGDAHRAGYDADSVRLAVYAVVAFLDESVLNSTQPMFSDWPRQPLQEEVFGDHTAGETFYRHLSELLARPDSDALADLLEVYQLCLLLGFRGRFAAGDGGEIHRFTSQVNDKLLRIRGGWPPFSPAARPPADEQVPRVEDPWLRRTAVTAAAAVVVALILFAIFRGMLSPGHQELRDLAATLAAAGGMAS